MHKSAFALLLALAVLVPACAPKKAATATDVSAKGLDKNASADYYYLLYMDLSRQGQPRLAAQVLEKLIKLSPTPELYRDLANLHWELGEPDKTREVLKEGIEKYPDEKVLHFYLANSYLLQRRFDEAIQVLTNFLDKHPKNQSTLQELAAVMVEAKRFKPALELLASVPKDKRSPIMAYYESRAYDGLGNKKMAMEKLHEALREDPNLLPALSELAITYEREKNYRQAEDAYRRILDLGEDNPEVWLRLIRLSLMEKNEAKAMDYLDKAPADRAFLFQVLGLFEDEGYKEGASRVLERLSKEDPGNPDVIFLQALIAWEKDKNLDRAMDILARIPKDSPAYDKSLSTRIQLALDSNRYDLAQPLIDEGKKAYPDRIEYWFFQAVLYDKQGDLAHAAQAYQEAVAKWPSNTEAIYRLAMVYERQGNHKEAMELGEKVLAMEPNNPDAQNFVGYSLAEEGRDLDRAMELISKAVATTPDSPYYLDSLAWVLHKRGEDAKAWEEIQKAVSKPLEDSAIWEHYGDIAKAMNLGKEAAKGYKRALEMNPANADEIKSKLKGLR